ncbi:3-isopropylmalate dehydratase large subunit [Aquibium sp. ELW1220]|uniref:3-isopropylmalate dehydratase large subunit n=1 Tax=Aquibium sp. ELW1220 TaxID=2976766 RepID=UPI0025B0084C|nr:3-isopropylmalate dehydratase large subunit [Aquibium sp. ELW1220]MDN2583109.1 3-isopropylmalate dehydratase large subunit [Aquibium sp. ELW1220]
MTGRTLYDKVWDSHAVKTYEDGSTLLYVDRHLVQEVSSPQAFDGLKAMGRALRRPDAHVAVADHAVPTRMRDKPLPDGLAARQVSRLVDNARAFGVPYIPMNDRRHGIVHVIGPELGFTLPGATLVCGDSHTCTHGAFGAIAFGIGASECETVFATQTIRQTKQKRMRVRLLGAPGPGVTVKDIILALIAKVGTGGGFGHAIEYAGPAIAALSMEARMTLCNMSIEAGSRVGMVAPDETTFAYLQGRPLAPAGALWDRAVAEWRTLASDADAVFDREVELDVSAIAPHVSWGTTPEETLPVTGAVPDPAAEPDPARRARLQKSLDYMGLTPGMPLKEIAIDRVFIGSCTNGRIEDLRRAAGVLSGRRIAPSVQGIVVPGSAGVRSQAEAEGLDRIFRDAGFEWRASGCSMCVAMNDDRLAEGERCASTSNRNFEGRQGKGGRTHLMSPEMAAAAAVAGRLSDVRDLGR